MLEKFLNKQIAKRMLEILIQMQFCSPSSVEGFSFLYIRRNYLLSINKFLMDLYRAPFYARNQNYLFISVILSNFNSVDFESNYVL